jgi:hypothetical protein
MTPSMTPRNPNPPTDEELEARLRASFERGVADAERGLATTDLLRATRPRRHAHPAMALTVLGIAAVTVVAVASLLGQPSPRTGTPSSAPAGTSGPTWSPAPSARPGVVIPVLGPYDSFPPAVDGEPIYPVGPALDAKIATTVDDAPFYVSGWYVTTEQWFTSEESRACSEPASPGPDRVFYPCSGFVLNESASGGERLRVHEVVAGLTGPLVMSHTFIEAQPVLLRIHVHDAMCASSDCASIPVFDAVVVWGAPQVAPVFLLATQPPSGITMDQAIAMAMPKAQNLVTRSDLLLLSARAGQRDVVGQSTVGPGHGGTTWVWAIAFVSSDGRFAATVYLDYVTGAWLGADRGLEAGEPFP